MKVILYTAKYCPYSLRAKIAIAEKKMSATIIESSELSPQKLKEIAPKGEFPVLKEKGYIVSNRKALMVYIDERFPAPNLLPNTVQDKVKLRLALEKIDTEWYPILAEVKKVRKQKEQLKVLFKDLEENLKAMEKVFTETEFFLCSSFTLADCYISAMFLYLESEGFIIDDSYGAIFDYKKRLFARDSVKKASLKNNSSGSLLKTLRTSTVR